MPKHRQTHKCKTKPHPNDKCNIIDGRAYLKGKSPFEGVWHEYHIPYDINEVENKPIIIKVFNNIHMKLKSYLYTDFL